MTKQSIKAPGPLVANLQKKRGLAMANRGPSNCLRARKIFTIALLPGVAGLTLNGDPHDQCIQCLSCYHHMNICNVCTLARPTFQHCLAIRLYLCNLEHQSLPFQPVAIPDSGITWLALHLGSVEHAQSCF